MWSGGSRRWISIEKTERKVKCPYCGYEMPVTYRKEAVCRGVFLRCKGRGCKKVFEIKIPAK